MGHMVRTVASRYIVSAVPEDHSQAERWEIVVERRRQVDGTFLWAVRRPEHRVVLNGDGGWDAEIGGGDDWLDVHRFPLEQALRLAETAAPTVIHAGVKAKDVRSTERKGAT